MAYEKRPKAIDLSHHLSEQAKARKVSPLKGLQRFLGKPGVISLAGGLPSANYFPFENVSADILPIDAFSATPGEQLPSLSWLWKLFGAGSKTTAITVPRYPETVGDVSLSISLQYGLATGMPQLQDFIKNFVAQVYRPAYDNFSILLHTGNTDGWSRCLQTLCNAGEGVLVEEWTYPSAMATVIPMGMTPINIEMDDEGMKADVLYTTLSEWNEEARGMPRPHVMYVVPVGQNPRGSTMGAGRKKEIYDICVKFDIIIVEDDPYYFLQEGEYVPTSERSSVTTLHKDKDEIERFISSLSPSFLRFDYEGRVIRLDTFSKVIAPGMRLGWFTCSELFSERFQRMGETSTQAPCGVGQALTTKLLMSWKFEGYVRWLRGLRAEYTNRRNFFLDALVDEFHMQRSIGTSGIWRGCDVYTASAKVGSQEMIEKLPTIQHAMFSFVPPTSGMFVWIKLHLENHPSFIPGEEETLEMQLWTKIAEAGLLIGPGWMFSANGQTDVADMQLGAHLRICFSDAQPDTLKQAVSIFSKVIREWFNTN